MGLLSIIKRVFNPPYQLVLLDKIEGEKGKDVVYVFKQYGSHDVARVTYSEILDNSNLLHAIHPLTIAEIAESETIKKFKYNNKKITKELKGNNYEIGGRTYAGEYICNNIDMFFDLNLNDACHIAHSTGFFSGRELTKKLVNLENKKEYTRKHSSQVIAIHSVQRKIHSDL